MVDTSLVVAQLVPALNSDTAGNLTFWTSAQIYEWFDEAVKRLARGFGVFTEYDNTVLTVLGTGIYVMPARNLSVIQLDVAGVVLKADTTGGMESLDESWATTTGAAERYANSPGVDSVTICKVPDAPNAGLAIGVARQTYPTAVSSGAPQLSGVPSVLQDYWYFAALARIRTAETKAAMPEVGTWAAGVRDLLEGIVKQYWGRGQ